ncbi:MAG: sulfurtransferase TusA family protein [Planctomycetota bacterium]|jgi:sulfite reductase (ferredoxin)
MDSILQLPEPVKQDVLGYRDEVAKFVRGETSAVAFRAYRVPMGIYEQRAAGMYMVRIRIGAGLVLPCQLERISELSNKYGNGIIHVTTRQDIQIHEVDIEQTPDVLEGLLEVGLAARGGGGNTVRNVTACPRAGVCPDEQFDVAGYAIATAEYLLQDRSSFNLPRKYKIVFSGCSSDCAFASVADLGFFAHNKDGKKGFSAYCGGGLGANPSVGVKVEDFIGESEILEVAQAVKQLFDKHGDRANKHKARLRYVLARVGEDAFRDMYKKERQEVARSGLSGDIPAIRDVNSGFRISGNELATESSGDNVLAEKSKGLYTIRINLKLGDILADGLARIGAIAGQFGSGLVRTTQKQNLMISSVRSENVAKVIAVLGKLDVSPRQGNGSVVACTGAATCKLGLCLSRGLADAITEKVSDKLNTTVRISGCPNSCGHHYISDIGFQGRARRVKDRLMPCYDVLAGAHITEGQAQLGEKIGTLPAKEIPAFLCDAVEAGSIGKQELKKLLGRYDESYLSNVPDDYYYDYGRSEPFSLAGRGPGECGAGVMDVMQVDIDQAKQAIKAASSTDQGSEKSEHLYTAIVSASRALLFLFGLEPKKDREVFSAFEEKLIVPGWVDSGAKNLLSHAIDWRMGDVESIEDIEQQIGNLVGRVEELFLSLDSSLKFKAEPMRQQVSSKADNSIIRLADLRGVGCPLNFVKAKLELEKIEVGEVLEVLLDEGEPVRNVPASFEGQGQEVVEVKQVDDHFCVRVRRVK